MRMVPVTRSMSRLLYLLTIGFFSLSLSVSPTEPAAVLEEGVSGSAAERALEKIKEGRGNARAKRYANATRSLRDAVALAEEAGATMVLAIALHNLAEVYRLQEKKLDALKYYYQANKIYIALKNQAGVELTQMRIGTLAPDSPKQPNIASAGERSAPMLEPVPDTETRMSRIESAVERIRKRVIPTTEDSPSVPSPPPGRQRLVPVTHLEIVRIENRSQAYRQYLDELARQLERIWRYPESAIRKHERGNAKMEFTIRKDGELVGVRILESSGFAALDLESLRTVRSAAPFKPLPAATGMGEATVRVTFNYGFEEDSSQITGDKRDPGSLGPP